MTASEPDVETPPSSPPSAPPPTGLRALAIVRGWPAARVTLAAWRARPVATFAPWVAISCCIALVLLGLVWLVGAYSPPDPTRLHIGRLLFVHPDWFDDSWRLFRSNLLVLALHAMACLAGFIVHLALTDPVEGEHPRIAAWSRGLAIVAVAFVPIATILSIGTQSWVLGARASTLADQLHLSIPAVLWSTVPHSLPELAAVFLPLAASMFLIAIGRPDQLLAATLATVVVAVPVLAASSIVETRVWPDRLLAARAADPHLEGQLVMRGVVDTIDPLAGTTELLTGPRVGDAHASLDQAIDAATRAAGRASVVLELHDRFIVHELDARRYPHRCDYLPGMRITTDAPAIDDVARLRWDPSASRPLDPRVRAFVGGMRVIEPDALDPGPVDQRAVRECSGG